jgi:hypothetical protein
MTTTTMPCTWTCRNCFVVGRMPVCNAGGNAGATKAAMPARQGQRGQYDMGNKAGAMPATMIAQSLQGCQRNMGKDASATPAKMPALNWLDIKAK